MVREKKNKTTWKRKTLTSLLKHYNKCILINSNNCSIQVINIIRLLPKSKLRCRSHIIPIQLSSQCEYRLISDIPIHNFFQIKASLLLTLFTKHESKSNESLV